MRVNTGYISSTKDTSFYVRCSYSHARWGYCRRFRSLLLCPSSVERSKLPLSAESTQAVQASFCYRLRAGEDHVIHHHSHSPFVTVQRRAPSRWKKKLAKVSQHPVLSQILSPSKAFSIFSTHTSLLSSFFFFFWGGLGLFVVFLCVFCFFVFFSCRPWSKGCGSESRWATLV